MLNTVLCNVLHCISCSGYMFMLRNPKPTQNNSTELIISPVLFSSHAVLCVRRELPTTRAQLFHCLHISLQILP